MKTFRIGLEHETDHPNGYGEDYREFITVADDEDDAAKIQAAVTRMANDVKLGDGYRIAVHQWFRD